MDQRTQASLIRMAKIVGLSVLPVLISSLQASTLDVRSIAIAVAVAALAGLQKYVSWTQEVTP